MLVELEELEELSTASNMYTSTFRWNSAREWDSNVCIGVSRVTE